MTHRRNERVAEEIRGVLAEAIREVRDPLVGFVTLTGVDLSPDLRQARIYVSRRVATETTAMLARCHTLASSSSSLTATLWRARRRSLTERRTWRLSFKDRDCGKWISKVRSPIVTR